MSATCGASLKRNRVTSLQFRATVGQDASEEFQANPGGFLAIAAKRHFAFRELNWDPLRTEEEKKRYREQRGEVEKVKQLIARWRKDWESGKLQGADATHSTVMRMTGAGRPFNFATFGDALCQYYLHVAEDAKLPRPRPLLMAKLAQLLMAAQEEGHVAIQVAGNGSVDAQWSAQLLKRWMAHHGLKVKTSTNKAKSQDEEVTLRAHTLFRNLVRIRTAYLPGKLGLDFYDHAPLLRRMSGGDTVGQKGAQSAFAEKTGAEGRGLRSWRRGVATGRSPIRPYYSERRTPGCSETSRKSISPLARRFLSNTTAPPRATRNRRSSSLNTSIARRGWRS